MLDFFFAILAAGINGADAGGQGTGGVAATEVAPVVAPASAPTAPSAGQAVDVPDQGVVSRGATAAADSPPSASGAGFNMAVVTAGLVAEDQTPSGRFTTAAEVKPILNATRGNWVALREYDGKDLLYVTHLWSWRCGLSALAISVNDEPMQNWPLPPCHAQTATPNAITETDALPYLSLRGGGVARITVQIVYDDLSMDAQTFERSAVLMP